MSARRRAINSACLVAVIVAAASPGAGADDRDPQHNERNRQRIAAMSAADRAHLEYQFERWRNLSEAERDRYRKLHHDLQRSAETGDDLRHAMQAYGEWLKSLSPWQKDELRNAPSAEARLQLVRQFKTEQEQRAQARLLISPEPGARPEGRGWGAPPLSIEEIDAMLRIMRAKSPLPADISKRIEGLATPHKQVSTVLEYLKAAGPRPGLSRWIDAQTADKMIAEIRHERVREWLQTTDDADRRRYTVGGILIRGVTHAAEQELDRRRPSEEELTDVFTKLPPETQDEIMRMPNEAARRRLTFHYFELSEDPFTRDFGELRRQLSQMFGGDGRGRGPRPPGPGGGDRSRDGRSRDDSERGGRDERSRPESGERGPEDERDSDKQD